MATANKKILILSIVLSISLLLRCVNDIILITMDDDMKKMESEKELFAF